MKNYLPVQATQKTWLWSMCQEDPWRRRRQPRPVFLQFRGQRSLAGYSPRCRKGLDTTMHVCEHTQTYIHAHTLPVNVGIQKQYSTSFLVFFLMYIYGVILYMYCYFILLLFSDEKRISINLLWLASWFFLCWQLINFIDTGIYVSKLKWGSKSTSLCYLEHWADLP